MTGPPLVNIPTFHHDTPMNDLPRTSFLHFPTDLPYIRSTKAHPLDWHCPGPGYLHTTCIETRSHSHYTRVKICAISMLLGPATPFWPENRVKLNRNEATKSKLCVMNSRTKTRSPKKKKIRSHIYKRDDSFKSPKPPRNFFSLKWIIFTNLYNTYNEGFDFSRWVRYPFETFDLDGSKASCWIW